MRVLTAVLVTVSVATASAQSLGEVARQEAERRKTVKAPGKIYTNDQLKADVPSVPTAEPDRAPAPPTPATATPTPRPTPAPSTSSSTASRPGTGLVATADEASWRGRIQAAREMISRSQIFADALQSRINGLSADFAARDDPAQRAVVANERQKSLDELERVKKDLQQHSRTLADIQEEGRKAGVPAGWLR